MVEYIRSDLEAILFHIKIAEANAAGRPLYGPDPDGDGPLQAGLIPAYNLAWGLRTIDGSYNNLLPGREYWGAANQPFPSHVDPSYRTFLVDMNGAAPGGLVPVSYAPTTTDPDGPGRALAGDVYDPALRTISNLIVDQTLSNPAAIIESLRRDGVEGDHLAIALEIKSAYEALPVLARAAAAARIAETTALGALATETAQHALADAAATSAATALAAATAAVTQDMADLTAATSASEAADAAAAAALDADAAAAATLAAAQLAYDAAFDAAGTTAAALAAATTQLASATSARSAAALALSAAIADAAAKASLEQAAADALLAALGIQSNAQAAYDVAASTLSAANDAVTTATAALTAATSASDAADAAHATAVAEEAAALAALTAAQDNHAAAVSANAPSAAALAAAAVALDAATDAHEAAVAATGVAQADALAKQAVEDEAASALLSAQEARAAAQQAVDDATIANQPSADALAAAVADLAVKTQAHDAAVLAVGVATTAAAEAQAAESAAAATLTLAQGVRDDAQVAVSAATTAHEANGTALATATTNLATATTARDAALAAVEDAQLVATDAAAAEAVAAANLTSAQGDLAAANAALTQATATVSAYDAALAVDAGAAAAAASAAVGALQSVLGAADAVLTAEESAARASALGSAIDSANDAHAAAAAVLAALQVAGVRSVDVDSAQANVASALALVGQLEAVQIALADDVLDQAEHDAAVATQASAQSLETATTSLSSEITTAGRPGAQAAAATAQDNVDTANGAVTAAQDALTLATADRTSADQALDAAEAALATAQTAVTNAQTAFDAATLAHAQSAAALASATADLAAAETAVTNALAALGAATTASDQADAALVTAQSDAQAAQVALADAEAAHQAAVIANQPTADALAAAVAALTAADGVVTGAQQALATATADSAAADAALGEAQGAEAAAAATMAAAQTDYDNALAANQPTADALQAAVVALNSATTAHTLAVEATASALAHAVAMAALQSAAEGDLASAQTDQASALATFEAAQTALAEASEGVTTAQVAFEAAAADSDAADAALVEAQGADAAALATLTAAQTAYDDAAAAAGPAAAELTAATTALNDATAAREAAAATLVAADQAAVEAQAAEEAAAADLAASQAVQSAAAVVNTDAQAALAAATAELTAAQSAATAATAAADAADLASETASVEFDALIVDNGIELEGSNVVLPAVATDEGLSAPFNGWFTLFGQFFDHGLDLVGKGGSGTVFIPLQKDDPLYDPGPDGIIGNADDSRTNFMVLTRATTSPGADGAFGTADDILPINGTTSFVDQNQTYGSHASHNAFLREYELTATGPQATGRLIEGPNGGMANWGQLKEYSSTILGIRLTDQDVGMVPLLRTDAYGNFIPGANGFPQVVIGIGPDGIPNTADDLVREGDPAANDGQGVSVTDAIRTSSAFLNDIAHHAAPNGVADADSALGLDNLGGPTTGIYDNEMLDRHFIAGDGRVNENIGLTAVHHIFHAEHNRMAEHTKEVALADAQKLLAGGATQAEAVAFLNEWLDVPVTEVPASIAGLDWNGERVFHAAKFGTEMQYQHLVFEEFARKIQPSINAFIVPDGYDATINPSIMAEFAHVVYRFGHSMLTESVDRFDKDFNPGHIGLIEAFLNPVQFDSDGTISDGIGAGDIIRGMTRQTGAQIDEFVTTALRNNLLGLPLDLATINLARGRDTGTPSLNAARREFYEVTNNNPALKPYESWTDFAAHLKNEASIINFIAAYGTHTLITGQTTIEGKRNAALTIITGESFGGLVVPADATDFLNATGAYAGGKLGGLEDVDLWIGGLAEETMPFGGMLGSTFNFVFEVQLESLQNGDRFYYLQRNTGQHLFEQLEANSLASMIMRHTDATHLPGDVFSDPGLNLEVDITKQFNDLDGDGDLESADPTSGNLLKKLVIRDDPRTAGVDTNYLRYTGDEHVVLGGTSGNDTLIAGIGDDTIHGDAGDDRLEGGFGNDEIRGGDGDDIVTDMGGDDTLKGGKGNDALNGGSGIDLILAGDGNDFAVLGGDGDGAVFGGLGNDFILNNLNSLPAHGNEGDDWIEDGGNAGIFADNFDDLQFRDAIRGNDVMIGVGGGFDEFVGEGGDDIMVGSLGAAKHAGMSGFDWVTYKNHAAGIDASLLDDFVFDEAPADPGDITLQRFESVEGLSGSRFNDRLTGSDWTSVNREAGAETAGFQGSFLDSTGIALIDGLQAVVGDGVTFYNSGDIILGGDGNDEFVGGGGDDIIDGDKWLNVRISVRENKDGTGAEIATANSMTELSAKIFNGTYNPGQLVIVREILSDTTNVTGALMNIDRAVYSGNLADYDIEGRTVDVDGVQITRARDIDGDGKITVSHIAGNQLDGTDKLSNIEELKFLDQTLTIAGPNLVRGPTLDLQSALPGTGFADTFTEDGAGARIALNARITEPVGANILSAQIRLTNAQPLDALTFAAALPTGITSSFGPTVAGEITLNLTGSATAAAYETAIQRIRFSSTSQDPSATPRAIEVKVTSADGTSPTALAAIAVVPVNDLPVAVADTIVTNIATGNIVIPEWTLLRNDSDVDNAVLDVSAVSLPVGVTGLSLATTPGAVTMADDTVSGGGFTYTASDGVGGLRTATVSMFNRGLTSVADNFNGANATTPSTASNSTGATAWTTDWVEANDDGNIRTGQIQIDAGASPGTDDLRFGVGDGGSISRVVNLLGAIDAKLTFAFDKNNIDVGETVEVQFAADGVNFVTLHTITNVNNTLANGNANGPMTVSLTGAYSANSAIRFVASGINAVGEDIRIDNVSIAYALPSAAVTAGGGNHVLVGNEAGSDFIAGLGDDIILANGGDDIIHWTVGDGRDFVDGGANGANGDRFVVNGDQTAEAFVVYARADAIAAGIAVQNTATEVVVTRNGVVAGELDNVEALTINTGAGVDTVTTVGNLGGMTVSSDAVEVPPATPDVIVTNISSGNIVVPEWALLRNDSNVVGAVLDITAVSLPAGVTALSLATNPGSVTFADDGVGDGGFSYTANDSGALRTGTVTMFNRGLTSVADNFNGANATTPSTASNSTGATAWTTSWVEANDNGNLRTGQIQLDGGANPGSDDLRFGVGDGASISRVINLAGASDARLTFSFDKNNIDVGESVQVQFAADGVNFVTVHTITNVNNTVANGNANGPMTVALTGAYSANSAIRFVASAIDTAGEDIRIDNVTVNYAIVNDTVSAGGGNQVFVGNDSGSTFSGGAGDDIVFANGGDDVITWGSGHGRDFVDGGSNGAAGDRFIVNGDNSVEAYVVYARAEAIAAGITDLNAATEIVVTRNGAVIGELDNVEEITINTAGGADTVAAVGDFGPTSLFFNTITVNGQGGRDTIDASKLTSAHRLVLNRDPGEGGDGFILAAEGVANLGKSPLLRMNQYELNGYGEFGIAGVSETSASDGGGKYNPFFERVVAVDAPLYEPIELPTNPNSAVPQFTADYLII